MSATVGVPIYGISRYEYTTEIIEHGGKTDVLVQRLNELGQEGWQCVCANEHEGESFLVILQRPVVTKKD